jgi:hypothetical protein
MTRNGANLAEMFARNSYVIIRSLLTGPKLGLLYKYALMRARNGTMELNTLQAPGTPSAHGDLFMDGVLKELLPVIEQTSGVKLFPTYSYFRVYKREDVLEKHKDRPACEISVTLSVGYQADHPWPIWIEGPCGTTGVSLLPGDGLLYRGAECFHWREAFRGDHAVQVFLHYVDQTGPHAQWRFDKRPRLALVPPIEPVA